MTDRAVAIIDGHAIMSLASAVNIGQIDWQKFANTLEEQFDVNLTLRRIYFAAGERNSESNIYRLIDFLLYHHWYVHVQETFTITKEGEDTPRRRGHLLHVPITTDIMSLQQHFDTMFICLLDSTYEYLFRILQMNSIYINLIGITQKDITNTEQTTFTGTRLRQACQQFINLTDMKSRVEKVS